jgi:predicted amino acid-binding ACT domain protein
MSHWESSGLYKRADLQKGLQEAQQDAEIATQFLNRLLRLKNKLARVGETVSEDTILMHLVAGLRDEYVSITETWDESTMTLEKAKTNLKVKVRVE